MGIYSNLRIFKCDTPGCMNWELHAEVPVPNKNIPNWVSFPGEDGACDPWHVVFKNDGNVVIHGAKKQQVSILTYCPECREAQLEQEKLTGAEGSQEAGFAFTKRKKDNRS